MLATEKAHTFISHALHEGVWPLGTRLPSIDLLAVEARVSRNTMWKAIQQAKSENLLTVSRGGYIIAGAVAPLTKPSKILLSQPYDRGSRWHATKALVATDVAAGVYGLRGNLPTMKELVARYGVCFRTMVKILRTMTAEGVLQLSGRGYALPQIGGVRFRQNLVFVTCLGHFAQVSALNHEHNRIVNLFEGECTRLRFGIDIVEIDFYDSQASRNAALSLKTSEATVGYILDAWWYPGSEFQRAITDVLDKIVSFGKPVAILDEIGEFELPPHHATNRLVQAYSIEGSRAGERMAEFLALKGHREVAFLSLAPQAPWSSDRQNGVQSFFAAQKYPTAVHVVDDPQSKIAPSGAISLLAASGLGHADVKKLIAIGRTKSQAKDLEHEWNEFVKTSAWNKTGSQFKEKKFRKNMAGLGAVLHYGFDPDFLERSTRAIIYAGADRVFTTAVEPLFERALQFNGVTAWICANDGTAIEALKFLRSKSVRVPQELSVVGFDNVPVRALEMKLTTLDFNAAGFVNRMLGFILRPPRPRGIYRHKKIEVEGIIMERDTAGRARQERGS